MLKIPSFKQKDNDGNWIKSDFKFTFYKFTDFNPIGIENLLNSSFVEYSKLCRKLPERIDVQDILKQNPGSIEEIDNAISTFLKKIEYVSMYKLNWNISDTVLDKLKEVVLHQYYFVIHIRENNFSYFNISPSQFGIFIHYFFADILIIFLKEIINRTEIGNLLAKNNYISFNHLPFWAGYFIEKIAPDSKYFNSICKGTIWDGVEKDRWFVLNLLFESKDIRKLIDNEMCFDRYLGLIQRFYLVNKNVKLDCELSKTKSFQIEHQTLKELNFKLQDKNNELLDLIKKLKKPGTKKPFPEYINSDQNKWDDVIIIFIESTNQFNYKIINGTKPFKLSLLRNALLSLIISSKEQQQDYDYKHNKTTFSRLNKELKELFNKECNPIEWNSNQKVYKIHFKYQIIENAEHFKEKYLTKEMETMLQCNEEEIE
ncbi:MAG: hypothetical protein P9M11_09680 [Candidatus Tenebribacter burtonii]|jgi:hypothetical protein|nr:hypothetical protein [Candidatus Tenebribacter burtonii]